MTSSASALSVNLVNPCIVEERNLPAMAFELPLYARGDDQISHLRRQEAPQPAHALDFAYLVGDALFQVLIRPIPLIAPEAVGSCLERSFEQPRIFNGDDCLRCEVLQQRQWCSSLERAYLLSEDGDNTSNLVLMEHWHAQHAFDTRPFLRLTLRMVRLPNIPVP